MTAKVLKRAYYSTEIAPPSSTATSTIFMACAIARAWRNGPPSAEALCERFGMSRATAYRWIGAWKAANGVA